MIAYVQLDLGLNDARVKIPWDGRDPRALTRGAKLLYLRREPGGVSPPPDPRQLEMFIRHQARRYLGAPLLLKL